MFELSIDQKVVQEPDGSARTLFKDVSLTMGEPDTSLAVLGRSGVGKTTLLRMLAGLDVDYEGSYSFRGSVLPKQLDFMATMRAREIGYITQRSILLRDMNVIQNVTLGMSRRQVSLDAVEALLRQVGLSGAERKNVGRLSGGEAQRVAIARTLVRKPRLVLADEPTGSLDEATESDVLDLFQDLQGQGVKFVIATHSTHVADFCARRVSIHKSGLLEA
ncbi:MAG TPA: ABC transporter ATP-binding protein [Arachnia sp.]|nr:ABC transporter ATP-binding protein [Arachnia sp.]HMT84999.1 ABC transporter ATP-binding protein [Arachnia sp.]